VSFERPKSDGGNRITGYTVISHPEGMRATGKESPITIRGLTNGKEYTFTVSAGNSVGTGVASEPSNRVKPHE
jgi:predicted RNA-binding protein with TRAM domain